MAKKGWKGGREKRGGGGERERESYRSEYKRIKNRLLVATLPGALRTMLGLVGPMSVHCASA